MQGKYPLQPGVARPVSRGLVTPRTPIALGRARALEGGRRLIRRARLRFRSPAASARVRTKGRAHDARSRSDPGARSRRSASARRAEPARGGFRRGRRSDRGRPRYKADLSPPRPRPRRWRAVPPDTRAARCESVGPAREARRGSGHGPSARHTPRTTRRGHRDIDGPPARGRRRPRRSGLRDRLRGSVGRWTGMPRLARTGGAR